jgi:hypothetical protein
MNQDDIDRIADTTAIKLKTSLSEMSANINGLEDLLITTHAVSLQNKEDIAVLREITAERNRSIEDAIVTHRDRIGDLFTRTETTHQCIHEDDIRELRTAHDKTVGFWGGINKTMVAIAGLITLLITIAGIAITYLATK